MVVRTAEPEQPLYETDETAWLERSAELIRSGRFEGLDVPQLVDYLSDMARCDRREVTTRLIALLVHLLKWDLQPEGRCGPWLSAIFEQQRELRSLLESGTLFNHAGDVLSDAYSHSIKQAAAVLNLPRKGFPAECPWNLETMLIDPVGEE